MDRAPLEPAASPEHGVTLSETDQAAREREKILVEVFPVVPRDLVVLAIRVVVALLCASELVAPEKHRHTLRQHERGEKIRCLPPPQRVDLWIVGGALGAAVPRTIVAFA